MPNHKVVDAVRLDAAMTATADAIREKTSGTDPIPWNADTGFAEAVAGITGSGAAVPVPMKDVNFYDYDGTRLHSYTVEEAAALTELPPLPTQPGLICQGWNWTLDKIKAMGRAVDVGAMYITDDGKTRIYVEMPEWRTSPILGCCPNGTVTVDWGDGTEPDVLTGTDDATPMYTPRHTYSKPGKYIITLSVDGLMGLHGFAAGYSYCGLLLHSASGDDRNNVYMNTIQEVHIGSNVKNIRKWAFVYCHSLKYITIPKGVENIEPDCFYDCNSLVSLTIPKGLLNLGNGMCEECYSLEHCSMPDDYSIISYEVFEKCYSLKTFVIPDGAPYISQECFGYTSLRSIIIPDSVTQIVKSAFYYCHSLESVDIPVSVNYLGDGVFYECRSLKHVSLPEGIDTLGTNLFRFCMSLPSIVIPSTVVNIGNYAFATCDSLRVVDFTKCNTIPTVSNINAFSGIPEDCEIRVPAALADEWKAATNWSTYADYIVGV